MQRWAWVWAACIALVGPVPALLVAYAAAFAVAVGAPGTGPLAFGLTYAVILVAAVFMLEQLRRHVGAGRRLTLLGGGAICLVWSLAFWTISAQLT